MTRTFFLKTNRIGFSKWKQDDKELAELLWGDEKVTKYICASGHFSTDDIQNRLNREIDNNKEFSVQYWPIFELTSNELVGCCGLRPYAKTNMKSAFIFAQSFGERDMPQKQQML